MPDAIEAGPVSEFNPGVLASVDRYAVGNSNGKMFAVGRRCRHLMADLAEGNIDDDGCLTCPWHGAKYDVETGKMVLGPQGVFAKIPGLGTVFKVFTSVLPLGRRKVVAREAIYYLE
jgi:nitrite reductase/ring-hydroxylating ferredoxin subunit